MSIFGRRRQESEFDDGADGVFHAVFQHADGFVAVVVDGNTEHGIEQSTWSCLLDDDLDLPSELTALYDPELVEN